MYLSINPFVYLATYLSIYLSIYLPIHLSIYTVVNFDIGGITTKELMDYMRYGLLIFPGFALTDGLLRLQTNIVNECVIRSCEKFDTGRYGSVLVLNLVYMLGKR